MAWKHLGKFDARVDLVQATGLWVARVRKLPDGEWRNAEPGGSGHTTATEATDAAALTIDDWIASQQENIAVEVVRFMVEQRIRPVTVQVGSPPAPERWWEARGGTPLAWGAAFPTPQTAVADALARDRGVA